MISLHAQSIKIVNCSIPNVACLGVKFSVRFHFMFIHISVSPVCLLSGHLLGKSCSLG